MSSGRVLIAFDKFRGTLSSRDAGDICSRVLGGFFSCEVLELSDGGEGFAQTLEHSLGMKRKYVDVVGPIGETVKGYYCFNEKTAVVEMAVASGLDLVPVEKRNPMFTSSYGFGQLIKSAYEEGFRDIICGLGGSATNDAGIGALQALGVKVFVGEEELKERVKGETLARITKLVPVTDFLTDLRLRIACDVSNEFFGANGAVAVFSKQKGASEEERKTLEQGMRHVSSLFPKNIAPLPGSGAAGGTAGGLLAFLSGATLVGGSDLVAQALNLEEKIEHADLVITGEGSFDAQTESGKAVSKVIDLCKKHQKPLKIICGRKSVHVEGVEIWDFLSRFGEKESMNNAEKCLETLCKENLEKWKVH